MESPAQPGTRLANFSYEVERCKIRELAQAIGDPNPLYRDPAAAQGAGLPEVVAPPTFGTLVNLWGGPGAVELIQKLGANPLKVLHAEQAYEYLAPLHPGDRLEAEIELAEVYQKQSRSGSLRFFVLQTTSRNQRGETVLIGRSTLVERS